MWYTLLEVLRCPLCRGTLDLEPFEDRPPGAVPDRDQAGMPTDLASSDRWVDSGLLLCGGCRLWFPIFRGVPVLLPYRTGVHGEFTVKHGDRLRREAAEFSAADLDPAPGERFVQESFSEEWMEYSYDGTIWDLSYEDHEARFLAEVGPPLPSPDYSLEVGCGMGISTEMAQRNFGGQAIGVDLSFAVFRAAQHFAANPRLHFVQASVFHLPFEDAFADLVYSHGVLHHTHSTERAFRALAPHCASGGRLYVWVYGPGSIGEGWVRRIAFFVEDAVRPRMSRKLTSPLSRMFLGACAVGYLCVNAFHRLKDPTVRKYDFQKALHAARDRFTPQFAHRHRADEVSGWFEDEGFGETEVVDWREMPSANQANYRRNTGVRGVRVDVEDAGAGTLARRAAKEA